MVWDCSILYAYWSILFYRYPFKHKAVSKNNMSKGKVQIKRSLGGVSWQRERRKIIHLNWISNAVQNQEKEKVALLLWSKETMKKRGWRESCLYVAALLAQETIEPEGRWIFSLTHGLTLIFPPAFSYEALNISINHEIGCDGPEEGASS